MKQVNQVKLGAEFIKNALTAKCTTVASGRQE